MVVVLGCFFEALLKKTKFSMDIANIEFTCFICLLSFTVGLIAKKRVTATVAYSIYSSCLDMAVYAILLFLYRLEGVDVRIQRIKRRRRFFEVLALMDIIVLLSTFATDFYFRVEQYYIEQEFICWTPVYNKSFIMHLLLCYAIGFFVMVKFVKAAKRTRKYDRVKYITILLIFVIVLALNLISKIFSKYSYLDFAILAYGVMMIVGFAFTSYLLPKGIKRNMLSIASENISDGVICFDYLGKCIYINKTARKLYKGDDESCLWLEPYFESKETYIKRQETLFCDGKEHIFDVEFQCIKDNHNKNSGYYVHLKDRTYEVEVMEREQYRSTHDELTGVYNRKFFFEEAERILKENPDVPYYLIATDIENFKLVNDLFGTKFGDNLLKYQSEMLCKAKSEGIIHGRISGDKFGMLIPKQFFRQELAVENTRKVMAFETNSSFRVVMYLGLYEIANPYENVHTMWDKACLAIQNNTDKNQILNIYDTSLMNKIMNDNNIISEFKFAISKNQFHIFIQPQVDAKTGKCNGGEALCRWYDKSGYRQPGSFIPLLEKVGLIYQLDYYIWEKAVQTLGEWKKRGLDYYISVNISVKDFYYADIYSIFTGLVEKYNVEPSKLHLEITESVIIGDKEFHRDILSKLQSYGFSIEMDDFGSGFSSLNVLKEMNMDVLKIDMGFLHTSGNEDRGRVIISAIVKMAKSLGMKIISEGVETQAQANFLKSIDVDLLQGYLYSKPLPLEEFEQNFMEGAK